MYTVYTEPERLFKKKKKKNVIEILSEQERDKNMINNRQATRLKLQNCNIYFFLFTKYVKPEHCKTSVTLFPTTEYNA